MPLGRREFLKAAGWIAAGGAASACSPLHAEWARQAQTGPSWPVPTSSAFGVLQRLTFGPTIEEREHASSMGLEAWLEDQLAPGSIADPVADRLLRALDSLSLQAADLAAWDRQDVIAELRRSTLLRQIYSRRQLFEVMVEFWTDHFNIFIDKGDTWFLKPIDDRDVIRAHALGNFRDLLWASAHSPAMLVYLDNQANVKDAPNENYARELMELHTLGVDGGYNQLDVMELSRCLTGWTVRDHLWKGEFIFRSETHDDGWKEVLGLQVQPAGRLEAEDLIEMLATHPSTAEHLARKLVRRFIREDLEGQGETVSRVARVFLETRGDIASTLRALLLDSGRPLPTAPKFKRPLNFVVSSLRMLGAQTDAGPGLQQHLAAMGQLPFAWVTPDGPSDEAGPWKGGLMPRWQFAMDLTAGKIKGTRLPLDDWLEVVGPRTSSEMIDGMGMILLGDVPDSNTKAALEAVASDAAWPGRVPEVVAGMLASPDFQWR
ncbi:MAG TPA: DUF1800 domain-containing protein [Anaerolineales bacterium]|nr:DUF1800 domain-containing protein [Anaerolineales bacterium]